MDNDRKILPKLHAKLLRKRRGLNINSLLDTIGKFAIDIIKQLISMTLPALIKKTYIELDQRRLLGHVAIWMLAFILFGLLSVLGILDSRIQEKLLQYPNLSLSEAVNISRSMETSMATQKESAREPILVSFVNKHLQNSGFNASRSVPGYAGLSKSEELSNYSPVFYNPLRFKKSSRAQRSNVQIVNQEPRVDTRKTIRQVSEGAPTEAPEEQLFEDDEREHNEADPSAVENVVVHNLSGNKTGAASLQQLALRIVKESQSGHPSTEEQIGVRTPENIIGSSLQDNIILRGPRIKDHKNRRKQSSKPQKRKGGKKKKKVETRAGPVSSAIGIMRSAWNCFKSLIPGLR
ncbi:hypothetical protein Trydic_g796 [Trypoxylus dichotomus]